MNYGAEDKFRRTRFPARKRCAFSVVIALAAMFLGGNLPSSLAAPRARTKPASVKAAADYGKLPLMFEENQGQMDPRVKFFSRASGYTLSLTQGEAVLGLAHAGIKSNGASPSPPSMLRLKFAYANPSARIEGQNELPGKANYFLSDDPKQWHTNIPNYAGVAYREIYPGIDAVFRGNPQHLEFDFDLKPEANPSDIAIDVSGAEEVHVDANGDIVLNIGKAGKFDEVDLQRPVVYQETSGQRREIAGRFVLRGPHRIGFELGPYDHNQPLIIDPTLVYSTYLGGAQIYSIAVDPSGNSYIVGYTDGPFPPGSTTQPPFGDPEFVVKLTPDGSQLAYVAFIPGLTLPSIAVDGNGATYISGDLDQAYIVGGGYQNPNSTGGITAIKLSANGSQVVYAAQIGPPGYQAVTAGLAAIAVDSQGSVYIASNTNSSYYPTTSGAWQTTPINCYSGTCSNEATVTKLNPSGSSLVYSTLLGGSSGQDGAAAIAVDLQGDAYVAGLTGSTDFPTTPGAPQPQCLSWTGATAPYCDDYDGFVTELNPSGSALIYSTFLGDGLSNFGGGFDQAMGIAIDSAGEAYVSGTTESNIFASAVNPAITGPTVNCNPSSLGNPNQCAVVDINGVFGSLAFLAKISTGGNQLMYLGFVGAYSSSLPGSNENGATGTNTVALDSAGDAYLAGTTTSSFFPVTANALQTSQEATCNSQTGCGPEAFFSILDTTVGGSSSLFYSTYLGAESVSPYTSYNTAQGIGVDSAANAYIIGMIGAGNFTTTTGAFDPTCPTPATGGCSSTFAAKFGYGSSNPTISFSPPIANFGTISAPSGTLTLTVTNTGQANLVISNWTTASPFSAPQSDVNCGSNASNPPNIPPGASCTFTLSFSPVGNGSYSGTLTLVDNAPQGIPDPITAGDYDQVYLLEGAANFTGPTLVSISVTPPSPSIWVGSTQQYAAIGTYSDGSTQNLTGSATWSSSNTAVATINGAGLATGVAAGSSTITATSGSISGSATLNVALITLESISVTPANTSISIGTTQQYTATGTYSDGSTQNITSSVTWSSSNTAVATINSSGLATAVAIGSATISATSGSITGSTALTVTNPDVSDGETITVADQATVTPLINVAAPVAEYSLQQIGFSGASSGSQTVTVSNIGMDPMTLYSTLITGQGSAQFSVTLLYCSNSATSLQTTLPSGGACTFTVNYTASSNSANDNAMLTFTDNAALSNLTTMGSGSNCTQVILLSGSQGNTLPQGPPPAIVKVPDNEQITVQDQVTVKDQ